MNVINLDNLAENLMVKGLGIEYYEKIIKDVKPLDTTFQKAFNYFYKVRRDEGWLKAYYSLFEENRIKSELEFKEIIIDLYKRTDRVEASFASKMLATIKPDRPIWDKNVLKHLDSDLNLKNYLSSDLNLKGKDKDDKLLNAVSLYDEITVWYDEFLKTNNAKESINLFDFLMPHYKWLTSTKKIDFLIWGIG